MELIPDGVSTVLNPSFENIDDPTGNSYNYGFWALGGDAEATASTDCTTSTNGSCSADINIHKATSTDWYVQFTQRQNVAAGTTYILTFDAKSTVQGDADVVLQQEQDPWATFTWAMHFITYPTWNHYVIEFDPTTGGDPDTLFEFNLGTAAGHVWFDNVHMFKKAEYQDHSTTPALHRHLRLLGDSTASAYQIQVIHARRTGRQPLWDSGKTTLSPQTAIGAHTATSTYAGTSLPSDGTDANKYFWRMKVWNQSQFALTVDQRQRLLLHAGQSRARPLVHV